MINLNNLNLADVVSDIKEAFLSQEQFSMYRDIHEHFDFNNNFAGDDHVFSIFNKKENEFYFVISPYDEVSKKAPQQALTFKNGVIQLNFDFTSLADIRTGALDTVLLGSLGVKDLQDKNVLYIGTGSISQWSIKILKACYPELKKVSCINRSKSLSAEVEALANELGIIIEIVNKDSLCEFDYIFCHTSSDEPIITQADEKNLKSSVVIASYLTLYNFEEISDEFWDTDKNNVVVSWDNEIQNSKDLKRAEEAKILDKTKLITLRELLKNNRSIDITKRTVFRSAGTPIQNAGILNYVQKNKRSLNL